MHLRLAKFHPVSVFEQLTGITRPGPGVTGDTVHTWRLRPGSFPSALGMFSWGAPGVVSVAWDPARPVLWDADLDQSSGRPVVLFASGFHVREEGGWVYYEPPGEEPLLLAGAQRLNGSTSILLRVATRFPATVPADKAVDWVTRGTLTARTLAAWPKADRSWFRATRVRPPDDAEDDGPELLRAVLD